MLSQKVSAYIQTIRTQAGFLREYANMLLEEANRFATPHAEIMRRQSDVIRAIADARIVEATKFGELMCALSPPLASLIKTFAGQPIDETKQANLRPPVQVKASGYTAPELSPEEQGIAQAKKPQTKRRYPVLGRTVHDGDTIRAELDLGLGLYIVDNCRLRGINAPELSDHPRGDKARDYLRDLLSDAGEKNNLVFAEIVVGDERDKYGRLLVTLWIVYSNGDETCVNQEMIDNGYAAEFMASSLEDVPDEFKELYAAACDYRDSSKSKTGRTMSEYVAVSRLLSALKAIEKRT